MTAVRYGAPGVTRECPHCKEVVLESASMCPACRHYLRFVPGDDTPPIPAATPLRIEGTIRHPAQVEPWEYTVVVTIQNAKGEEIARKLVGVGAMIGDETRTFTLSVEAVEAKAKLPGRTVRA